MVTKYWRGNTCLKSSLLPELATYCMTLTMPESWAFWAATLTATLNLIPCHVLILCTLCFPCHGRVFTSITQEMKQNVITVSSSCRADRQHGAWNTGQESAFHKCHLLGRTQMKHPLLGHPALNAAMASSLQQGARQWQWFQINSFQAHSHRDFHPLLLHTGTVTQARKFYYRTSNGVMPCKHPWEG